MLLDREPVEGVEVGEVAASRERHGLPVFATSMVGGAERQDRFIEHVIIEVNERLCEVGSGVADHLVGDPRELCSGKASTEVLDAGGCDGQQSSPVGCAGDRWATQFGQGRLDDWVEVPGSVVGASTREFAEVDAVESSGESVRGGEPDGRGAPEAGHPRADAPFEGCKRVRGTVAAGVLSALAFRA